MAVAGTISIVATLCLLPVANRLSRRYGKKRVALGALALIAIGKASYVFTQTPGMPYLQVASNLIFQPATATLFMLIPAMIADVCDVDELESGKRREATFSAIYQWLWKLGSSLAIVVGGWLLAIIGAKGEAGMEAFSDDVVLRLRFVFYTVPPLFITVGFIAMCYFPLTRERVAEVKATLDEMRSR